MADKKEFLFEVMTPLGFRVHVTHAYWELIITISTLSWQDMRKKSKGRWNSQTKYAKANRTRMFIYFIKRNVKGAGSALFPGEQVMKAF